MQKQEELGFSQNVVGSGLMPEVVDGKVDARSVHEALEVASPFTHWFKRRVEEFGFEEGKDFSSKNSKTGAAGTSTNLSMFQQGVRTDFELSLDMAKELAMVERNEMGRKMRRYFIECEKRLRERPVPQATPALPVSALAKIQEINAVMISTLQQHDTAIGELRAQVVAGPEWECVHTWLARHGLDISIGRRNVLAQRCVTRSGAMGVPIGRRRYHNPGKRHNPERRTFRPDVIAFVWAQVSDRWMAREKGGQPA